MKLLERTSFPDTLGREWIFVRMHDAIQRCLAQMIAHGHSVKPTSAIQSAAITPKHMETLRNSPTGRHSSLGGPEDTVIGVATHSDPRLPFTSPFANDVAASEAQPLMTLGPVGLLGTAGDGTEVAPVHSLAAGFAARTTGGTVISQPLSSISSSQVGREISYPQACSAGYQQLSGTPEGTDVFQDAGSNHRQANGGGSCHSGSIGSGVPHQGSQPYGEVLFLTGNSVSPNTHPGVQ